MECKDCVYAKDMTDYICWCTKTSCRKQISKYETCKKFKNKYIDTKTNLTSSIHNDHAIYEKKIAELFKENENLKQTINDMKKSIGSKL